MSAKISVECPHCGHAQSESPAAISTTCKKCLQYFSLEYKAPDAGGRRLRKSRPSRLVECASCNSEQKVYEDALSAVCNTCGAHLNIGSYELDGIVRQRLATSGDIVFGPNTRYSGPEVKAQKVTVSGQIKARVRAVIEIVLSKKSEVRGALVAPLVRALKGAEAEADRVQTRLLQADGAVSAKRIYARDGIEVGREGRVAAPILITPWITVETGGSLVGRLDTTAVPVSAPAEDEEEPEN